MKITLIALALSIIGGLMLAYAIYGIILSILNYHMILPTSISEFLNFYFGETFKSINDVVFMGIFGACGAIIVYIGFYMLFIFRK